MAVKVKHISESDKGMSEQYIVKYTIERMGLTWYNDEMFCVTNSRQAHKQVGSYAKGYLSNIHNSNVNIISVDYC